MIKHLPELQEIIQSGYDLAKKKGVFVAQIYNLPGFLMSGNPHGVRTPETFESHYSIDQNGMIVTGYMRGFFEGFSCRDESDGIKILYTAHAKTPHPHLFIFTEDPTNEAINRFSNAFVSSIHKA